MLCQPGISSQRSVVEGADCHISVASQDIVGAVSPNINVATPNLVSLRRPSVPFVLPNSAVKWATPTGQKTSKVAHEIFKTNK